MHTLSEAGFKFRGDDLSEFEHRCTESSFLVRACPACLTSMHYICSLNPFFLHLAPPGETGCRSEIEVTWQQPTFQHFFERLDEAAWMIFFQGK